MNTRLSLAAALGGLLLAGCGGAPTGAGTATTPPGATPRVAVLHAAFEGRSYRVWRPAGTPRATLLALHPVHGAGDSFAAMTAFDAAARSRGWLAVYPDAPGGEWNTGFCCPFAAAPSRDDAGYLVRLLAELGAVPRSTYVAGFSNGGMMAYELACAYPARFAALFADAADSPECSPPGRLPAILHEQGGADPESGGRVWGLRNGQWVNTEPSAVARWRRLGAEATLVTVPNGGHAWFPDATDRAVAFFDSIRR